MAIKLNYRYDNFRNWSRLCHCWIWSHRKRWAWKMQGDWLWCNQHSKRRRFSSSPCNDSRRHEMFNTKVQARCCCGWRVVFQSKHNNRHCSCRSKRRNSLHSNSNCSKSSWVHANANQTCNHWRWQSRQTTSPVHDKNIARSQICPKARWRCRCTCSCTLSCTNKSQTHTLRSWNFHKQQFEKNWYERNYSKNKTKKGNKWYIH